MLLLTLWGSLAMAAPADPAPITYAEAMTAAIERNPDLRKASFAETQSEAQILSALGEFDPNLTWNGTWRPNNKQQGFFQGFPFEQESRGWSTDVGVQGSVPSGTAYSLTADVQQNYSRFQSFFGGIENEQIQDAYNANLDASLTQQILKGHRFSYNAQRVKQARQGEQTASLQRENTRQQVLGQTAQAYWAWEYQVQLARIAEDAITVAAEALRIGEAKVASGQLAPVERTRLEAALVQAQSAAMDAHNAESAAADALLMMMGDRPGRAIQPATEIGLILPLDIEAERAVEVALAQNLDLSVSRSNAELAELDRVNAKHGLLPSWSATISAGARAQHNAANSDQSVVSGLAANTFPYWQVSSQLSVPLGNRAARGEAGRSASIVDQRKTELEALERQVRQQVEAQVRTLRAGQQRVQLADANLRLALETLAAEEALQDAGRAIAKDVLEARTEVSRKRVDAAKARTDYRLAQVELLRLQGQLTEALP
jgi:outer membrane protein TolC